MNSDEAASYRTGPLPVVPSEPGPDPVASARIRGRLSGGRLEHLQNLIAGWHMLADFCFSDLLLFVPVDDAAKRFVAIGQVRPSTSQTLYRTDMIGTEVDEGDRPLIMRSYALGEIIDGEYFVSTMHERVRVVCIPVRHQGQVIAVMSRETPPSVGRQSGELERVYAEIFNYFARMITAGVYPFSEVDSDSDEVPRVGDGVMLLDQDSRVSYASPNAVSALHRVGVHANAEGMRLGDLGFDDDAVQTAYNVGRPVTTEVEWIGDVTVMIHCIPLIDRGEVSGAVILLRDISELRRRDRLLLSKDATIREIHHRVKNNLQTVSALLRLQGRRLAGPEAKEAIDDSVRRIRSIALVHDMLSRDSGDEIPFVDILRPLVRMVEDGLISAEREVSLSVEGDAGIVPSEIVTPLAVVINELLQNAVDHGFPEPLSGGEVRVSVASVADRLEITVYDNGVGLPDGFDFSKATGLGLSIVRALVVSDLRGVITAESPGGGVPGTLVALSVPLHPR